MNDTISASVASSAASQLQDLLSTLRTRTYTAVDDAEKEVQAGDELAHLVLTLLNGWRPQFRRDALEAIMSLCEYGLDLQEEEDAYEIEQDRERLVTSAD